MDCEKCLALIDDFLDAKLSSAESAAVGEHLQICVDCAVFQADLTTVFESCEDLREHLVEPPNSQALWLRISNLIESEQNALVLAEAKNVVRVAPKTSWWGRSWQLSFQQMASAVLGVAVITSLLTVVGLQNAASVKNSVAVQFFQPSEAQKPTAGRTIELENRVREQQMAIEYWNRRVEARRTQWNRHLREAFDRNLTAINQVVSDYEQQLQTNPDDRISEEMLDSALNDKMQLLREFSEL